MSQEQNKDMSQYFYRASAADFMKIPGSPVAYWATERQRLAFENMPTIGSWAPVKQGLATADNNRFIRLWHEVPRDKIGLNYQSTEETIDSNHRWFPYNKGGDYRRWYGNFEYVVLWERDGEQIRSFADESGYIRSRAQNTNFYFKQGVTWTFISSSNFGVRYTPYGSIFDVAGSSAFPPNDLTKKLTSFMCSSAAWSFLKLLNPTLNFQVGNVASLPISVEKLSLIDEQVCEKLIYYSKKDWDSTEISWDFTQHPLVQPDYQVSTLSKTYAELRSNWKAIVENVNQLEIQNNEVFSNLLKLENNLSNTIAPEEITLTCNPHYRYGNNRSEEELETLLQCDTIRELASYAIGCMMGRYSLDKPGLILASQGETLQDYLRQIPNPSFAPDADAILPLTDQEWFTDDATNRFREFVRVVWGEDNLQENLDFVAESLCLHAIKAKRGESALDTIRRYLSTQFFKDHLRTYKKRPIYWLFSSGKHKAFECLVYLHRYNEGTLARMRTEYVIPLSARLNSYAEKLEQAKEAADSTAETKRLEKELATLHNQQAELAEFDEKLRHYADQRISLDLDDGVKVNYGKFGGLLAEVKSITGESPS